MSVVAALALVAAIIWPGYEVQQTPMQSASVWALQTGEGTRYARVNTDLGELDTVRPVENPSQLVQSSNRVLVFTQANAAFADVNLAMPQELDKAAAETMTRTPQGTSSISAAGDYIVYLTERGKVFYSSLGDAAATPVEVSFGVGFAVTSVAVDANGKIAAYSASKKSVQTYDVNGSALGDAAKLTKAPQAADAQLSLVSGEWFLLDAAKSRIFSESSPKPISVTVTGQARIQKPSLSGAELLIADSGGLYAFTAGNAELKTLVSASRISGIPAAPVVVAGVSYAAWLGEGDSSGALWSSAKGLKKLGYAGADIGDQPLPEFRVSGDRAILNDTKSGWVWQIPSGALVASSQSWVSDQSDSKAQTQNEDRADRVIDPKPPVAVDDSFGVRADSQIALQVMLNDSDPNEDVLSILPESLSGLPASFGAIALAENNQQVVVTVAPSASGSASFTYQLTDGSSSDGLNSNVATVTLSVVAQNINREPVWCGVENCLAQWPTPEVAPGGTVSVPVLSGWVDPDGDPVFVSNVENQGDVGNATYKPSGDVIYSHPDPNTNQELSVPLQVTVSDDRMAAATKVLSVSVTGSPTLVVKSFAVSGVIAQALTVFPMEHVTGVTGNAELTAVEALDSQRSKATINSNASSFEFEASSAGSYLVRYTVRDEESERTGLVRLLMQASDTATFTATPLSVFVWPQEDVTIDVLAGVSNPTGRVLSVSDAQPAPLPNAMMGVDVLSQQYLKISGGSETGEAGSLGKVRYEIVDVSSGQSAIGLVSVVLMPAASPAAPIAVDDRLTVRAGAQVDIPVLENDAAAAGSMIAVDSNAVSNSADEQSLAFASGRLLRYLAPKKAGTYELSYRIYTVGYPKLADTATVTVTVLGAEANRKPQPRTLSGRVLSGETARIEFDSFGIDPDGDAVVLDQVLTQPEHGSAVISSDGTALEYASEIDFTGQVSFNYQVRDSLGNTGVARVRVAVRDAQLDPRPVVYTDLVQVQAGANNSVVVEPLLNDVDPAGLPLKLVSVAPNAAPDTAEFGELKKRILSVKNDQVVFAAGTVLGNASFTYNVQNEDGDTAIGLIVVKVIRDAVVSNPVVADTVLDLESRQKFPRGIDVVSGKVSWLSGDVAELKLTLWGNPVDINAAGWSISGPLPDKTRVIPFKLSGIGFDGEERFSYGFLRVPGEDDLRLALKSTLSELKVGEGETVSFDMVRLVNAPAGSELKVYATEVRSSGVRQQAKCESISGTEIRYTAGKGAPWHDSCTVPVKLATQNVYTYLTVPIAIEADEPQPELSPAAVTVSPGESINYDLKQMVEWTGGENWAELQLAVEPGGESFVTELSGTTLAIRATDTAKPGAQQAATVSVTSHKDVKPAALTLRVGPAPSTLPQGATVTQRCSMADATSCDISVIGAPGEVNPLPNTALKLVAVDQPEMCPNVSFTVAGGSVRAAWTEAAVGAQCTANFTVQDAQERQSLGDRMGSVTLDLQGFPQSPSSLTLKSFADSSVTLAVNPGDASNAYPALDGFVIYRGAEKVAECGPSGQDCSAIRGLTNGEQVLFEARSVSAVGESRGQNPTLTTWAYRAPTIDSVIATPTYTPGQTSATEGTVQLEINTNDAEVRAFTVSGASGEVTRTGGRTVVTVLLGVSTPTIVVTPLSQFEAPDGGSSSGSSQTVGVSVAGLPVLGDLNVVSVDANSITVSPIAVDMNGSNRSREIIYVAHQAGGSASCSVASSGGSLSATVNDGVQSTSNVITGLSSNVAYTVRACVSNGFGLTESNSITATPFSAPAAPTGYSYSIRDGSADGQYSIIRNDGSSPPSGFSLIIDGDDKLGAEFTGMTAKFCLTSDPTKCSAEAQIPPSSSVAAVPLAATAGAVTCAVGSAFSATVAASGISGGFSEVQYFDGGTWQTLATTADPIPSGATQVRGKYSFNTVGTTGLTPYTVNCTP